MLLSVHNSSVFLSPVIDLILLSPLFVNCFSSRSPFFLGFCFTAFMHLTVCFLIPSSSSSSSCINSPQTGLPCVWLLYPGDAIQIKFLLIIIIIIIILHLPV